VLERAALFALSMLIGLVDLAVALFVAAYLGVIPKDKVQTMLHFMGNLPVVGGMVSKQAPAAIAPAKAAKPAAKKKR
jgi:hypothetical protein